MSEDLTTALDLFKTGLPGMVHAHVKTPVLISSRIGRPLWDYRSDIELLQGLLDALDAHELLWEQRIVRGTIDAESILLTQIHDTSGAAAFLSDIEPLDAVISKLDRVSPLGVTDFALRRRTTSRTRHSAVFTGTLQFIALELLEAAIAKRSVLRTAEHDVESFTLVLGYCVLRKLCNKLYAIKGDGEEYQFMKTAFTEAFGALPVEGILSSRRAAKPFGWCDEYAPGFMEPFFQAHISEPLRRLLRTFQSHVGQRQVRIQAEDRELGLVSVAPFTHGTLRKRVHTAIQQLQDDLLM